MANPPPRTSRVTADEDIDYCITVGNQRGRAANPDGRRGQIVAIFKAAPHWGRYLDEKYVTNSPLPPGTSALYVYAKIDDVWVAQYANTTTQPAESDELDLQANVTMASLRDANRKLDDANELVNQRLQEAANAAARDRHVLEQVRAHEATLQGLEERVRAERAFLASERERCAREVNLYEERVHRETAALEELLSQRRSWAEAEEARLQASLEAATRSIVEGHNTQVAIRQKFTAAEGELIEAEAQTVTAVAYRRRAMQASATAFHAQVATMESEKLQALETMAMVGAAPVEHRETPADKIANVIVEKSKEIDAGKLLDFAIGFFQKRNAAQT